MMRPSMLLFTALTLIASAPLGQAAPRPFRVVLDPGHGGADLGATAEQDGKLLAEKDLTLALALEAKKQLQLRGIQVSLTRSRDAEVPLSERTALANRQKADLFISIHMNSTPSGQRNPSPRGVETFILNNTSSESSLRLAYLENSSNRPNLPEVKTQADSADVALILKDLTLDANLSESKRLACAIQDTLVRVTGAKGPRDRGVKQALFHVLLGADMPSALLEAGFMSSPEDRIQVLQPLSRMKQAIALAQAVDQFRKDSGTRQARQSLSQCRVH
jgi:N-acetylmuramoyl-L-alanine amidase